RVGVVHVTQELFLGVLVTRCPIPADANAEEAWPATLTLSLPDRIEHARPHALQVPVGPLAADRRGERILGTHVLTTATFEYQAEVDGLRGVMVPVEDGAARPEVVARILARNGVDGVLTQVTLGSGLRNGVLAQRLQGQLIEPDWRSRIKGDCASILANGGAQ